MAKKITKPNPTKSIKNFLRQHSARYFEPLHRVDDILAAALAPEGAEPIPVARLAERLGVRPGEMVSQYDIDCTTLETRDRVDAEIKLLNFHTPKMQATTVDLAVSDDARTIDQRLADLTTNI